MAKSKEPSALSDIAEAGAKGLASPSPAAKIAGGIIAPPNAGEAAASLLQAGTNVAITGSKKLMEGVIRQHGKGPAAVLNDLQIKQALDKNAQTGQNKGIEAARQKAAAKAKESGKSQSTNKGIASYQSKASG
ncbi:MAG: hypothetical protein LBQ94_13175, partial [Treponema sp.]|nr:hypothetical protein [Treponema sp.]